MVNDIEISKTMKDSYLAYSMSVIAGRAIPDARDGMKPVQRRILYAMSDLGISSKSAYKKSARIVGDVIGKYHPHGDTAVYEALVRLAQPFNMRETIVDGQGNFGSIDGDSAAAMRYTEARMTRLGEELLTDINKDTVDWIDNYDNSLKEPAVLPTRVPTLLLNGASGIAVAMATEIPTHNLNELIDALIYMLSNPNYTEREILSIVKGPDFPTGGVIEGTSGIHSAYTTGNGSITISSKYHMEDKNGKQLIIIDEIPYGENKQRLYENITNLCKEKKIDGINSVIDESDRRGIRLVIELKKNINAQVILNQLFKLTSLRKKQHISLLAIHNKKPKLFRLVELLNIFLEHRKTIVIRRTQFDYNNALKEKNIKEGLLVASKNIDKVIKIIKESDSVEDARNNLIEKILRPNSGSIVVTQEDLEAKAKAILDMRLSKLTKLSVNELDMAIVSLNELIYKLRIILTNELELSKVIIDELKEIRVKFNSPRRTEIVENFTTVENIKELIPNDEVVITITKNGYIKRMLASNYEKQNRGGKGKLFVPSNDDDYVSNFYTCRNHDQLLVITSLGRAYPLPVYKIHEVDRTSKGRPIVNLLKLKEDEEPVSIIPISNFVGDIILVSRFGVIKRISSTLYQNLRNNGSHIIKLREGDTLISGILVSSNFTEDDTVEFSITNDSDDLDIDEGWVSGEYTDILSNTTLLVITKNGMGLRFDIDRLRSMGKTATGVRGIKLRDNDEVIGVLYTTNNDDEILTITENGLGKKTSISEFRTSNRGGYGVKCSKITAKSGSLVSAIQINSTNDIMILSTDGKMIRIPFDSIRKLSRASTGTYLIKPTDNNKVLSIGQCLE